MSALEFPRTVVRFGTAGEPETKSRPRFSTRGGRVHTYSTDAMKRSERGLAAAFIKEAGRINPSDKHQFSVEAEFYLGNGMRRDVDNMLKLVLDALNRIAWADDAQVVEVRGRKFLDSAEPRTNVCVSIVGIMPNRKARCEHCGDEFPRPPSQAARKYCSVACRRLGIAAKRTRACIQCGTQFVRNRDVGDQRYCSPSCVHAGTHVATTCARCGTAFEQPSSLNRNGNSYCSTECKDGYWREQRKSAAKGTCQDCGGPTTKKQYKRCRDCNFAAGGRWADRTAVTCPACGRFVADGGTCHNNQPGGEVA